MNIESGQLTLDQIKKKDIFADLSPHIVGSFWKYHEENPKVFKLFEQFANQLRSAGRKHYGVGSITERIRWHFAVETTGDEFKINNNYRSCYARLLILKDPTFEGFFELRRMPGSKET